MTDSPKERARLKQPSHANVAEKKFDAGAPLSVAMLAIVMIAIMALGKLATGLLLHSVALLSEGLHTFLDLFAAGISYYTVRAAAEPADSEHRYGHGKIENMAGIAQSAFIFAPAVIIIFRAVSGLINLDTVLSRGGVDIGTGVMGITILINIFLAMRLLAVSRKYKSEAIRAAAFHQLNDLWTSIGVFIALALIWWKPEWKILDPLVALIVTAISIWMAWELLKISVASLVDRSAGADVDNAIINVLHRQKNIVRGYHNLRTRTAGAEVLVDLHVEICGELSFREAHDITEKVEAEIAKELGRSDVIIHADPCVKDCNHCDLDVKERGT